MDENPYQPPETPIVPPPAKAKRDWLADSQLPTGAPLHVAKAKWGDAALVALVTLGLALLAAMIFGARLN